MQRRTFLRNSTLGTAGVLLNSHNLFAGKQWFPDKKIITISYNVYNFDGYPKTDDTKFIHKNS